MIKNLLFDLDDTLYCTVNTIGKNVHKRMISFIADFFNKTEEEVRTERSHRIPFYGTTLEWLMSEYGFSDTEQYFRAIHPAEEIDEVKFDPDLRPLLENLGQKYHLSVLTNSPFIHFDKLLKHLNVHDLFDGIYGIEDNNFQGKPHASAYLHAVEDRGFTVENTLFLDDLPKYVRGYVSLGGKAVLIDYTNRHADDPFVKENPTASLRSIYELPAFLESFGV